MIRSTSSAAAGRSVRIAVTCGEPAGIGAEVALKALARALPVGVSPLLVGPRQVWESAAALLSAPVDLDSWSAVEIPLGSVDWTWGHPSTGSGRIAAEAVEAAADLALARTVDAVVTAPLTKAGLAAAGRPYPGHTELLEARCGGRATMMLAGTRLKVLLVTTHLPLAGVAAAITTERVLATLVAAHRGLLEDLGVAAPRIAVSALNPHAGEGGVLGAEEAEVIVPALDRARGLGIDAAGPFPADSLFHRAATGEFDAVVAMYHDQGLVPLKLLHFHDGVNVTLGLPIVRTSPDHGTAFDLAGRGIAREESFVEALRWAAEIALRRRGNLRGET
jgi:4-hydroxythreonine-4-phosphate dehydrogenase